MDFLNQSYAQLKDLFDGMTPGSRITAGLLLVVVVVSLGYLFTHAVPGNSVYLLDGRRFSGSELGAMEAALHDAGLKCETDGGGRIRVPIGKKYEYMGALATAGAMPKEFGDDLRNTLESQSVFGNWKLTQEQLKAAMHREMAKIISAMPGISKAYVLSSSKIEPGWMKDEIVAATVNVEMTGSQALDQEQANIICSTMTGAIGGLTPERTTISDITNNRSFRGSSEDLLGTSGGSLAADTQYWQNYHQDLILRALPGIRGVTVSCNVTLSKEKSRIEESIGHDPKTLTTEMAEKTLTRTIEGAEPAGRPGALAQANAPRSLGASQGKGSKEDTEESDLTQSNIAVKSTQTKTEEMGRAVERVSVSINVPSTYFEDIWHQINDKPGEEPKEPDPNDLAQLEQTEMANIETIAAQLLPSVPGVDDLADLVQVRKFYPPTFEPIPEAGITESALVWLGRSWQTLGLIGLAFFSLLMIRSMVKSAAAVAASEAPTGGSGSESEEADDSAEQPTPPQLLRFGRAGKSLKDEVSDLVAEDPDAAANVLRNWIGSTSNVA